MFEIVVVEGMGCCCVWELLVSVFPSSSWFDCSSSLLWIEKVSGLSSSDIVKGDLSENWVLVFYEFRVSPLL